MGWFSKEKKTDREGPTIQATPTSIVREIIKRGYIDGADYPMLSCLENHPDYAHATEILKGAIEDGTVSV